LAFSALRVDFSLLVNTTQAVENEASDRRHYLFCDPVKNASEADSLILGKGNVLMFLLFYRH
jgi:hypothetical protein